MDLDNLTLENCEKYLPFILESEKKFPESIRLDSDQLLRILRGDRPIAKVARHNSRYIGNVLSFCPSEDDIEELDLKGVTHDPGLLYLYNFVIIPEFQGKVFGKAIFQDLVDTAKTRGYATLEGHFRRNASLHIVQSAGAEMTGIYPNWCDTGEEYVHCRLRL